MKKTRRRKQRKRDGPITMAVAFGRISPEDRARCMHVLKAFSERFQDIQPGALPFVPMEEVVRCLRRQAPINRGCARLACELERTYLPRDKGDREIVFQQYLSNAKVARHFGKYPARGKAMHWAAKKKVTAGYKWSLPKRSYVPDTDVHVHPVVTLRYLRPGKQPENGWWEVTVHKSLHSLAMQWLNDNCLPKSW